MEEWKKIEDFPNYEVSTFGNIRNLSGKILKHGYNNRKYHTITLSNGKNSHRTKLVHRLVAEAFIQVPENLQNIEHLQVNHKDGDKDNNSISNLEWCDQSYNMKESYRIGLRKYVPFVLSQEVREKKRQQRLGKPSTGKEIQMIDKDTGKVLHTFSSANAAAKLLPELNLRQDGISDAATHRRNHTSMYKGYIWKFTGNITNGKQE